MQVNSTYLCSMNCAKILLVVATIVAPLWAQEIFLERPYTLRTLDDHTVLSNLHDQTIGGDLTGIFPRRDSLWRKDLPQNSLVTWKGSDAFLAVSIEGGYAYLGSRSLGDTIKSMDGGLFIRGYKDSVEFWLDARVFNESHSRKNPASFDREFLEVQTDSLSHSNYTSYARYRGHIAAHMGWARLDFGRDAVQWGPGYFENLTLSQNAIPFRQMTLTNEIGPLTVISLYGDLLDYPNSMDNRNTRAHNLYAHRYELHATNNLTIAVSEQNVLDSINDPINFIPIVPLFMQKGQEPENYNNGGLSADFCYRRPGWFRVYSEYYLDDMQSPTKLLENTDAQEKWAYMGGVQWVHNFGAIEAGVISEFAHIEPWVYTHFIPFTSQASNEGQPLGNQLGPNSQSIDLMAYGRWHDKAAGYLKAQWWWKGTDSSSFLENPCPTNETTTPKHYLAGAKMKFTLTPSFVYNMRNVGLEVDLSVFDNPGFFTRLGFQW